jgi:protein transport protein SEC24
MSGRRTDCNSRPELTYGTIDIVAPGDYSLKKPSKAHILFALDSSRSAVQCGAFMAYIQSVRTFLQNPQTAQQYSRIGIVTFDKYIQYYDLREGLTEPQTLVISDVMDPFVPLKNGLFFDPVTSMNTALALLDKLPKLVGDTRVVDSCFGSVVSSCLEALVTHYL